MTEPIRETGIRRSSPLATTVKRGTQKLSASVTSAIRKGTAKLSAVPDRLHLSTAQKLKEGNRIALSEAGGTLAGVFTHPLGTLKSIARGIGDLVVHPDKAVASVADRFKRDPFDGVVATANLGAAYAGLGSLALVAGAFVAAPFTGGASLAILPLAGTLGSAAGAAGLVTLGASFAKNQVDIARSETRSELEKEAGELGADYANAGLQAVGYGAGKALHKAAEAIKPKNLTPSSAQRAYDTLADKVREKLAHQQADAHGGVKTNDMSLEQVRQEGIRQVQEAVDWSVQGKRDLHVVDVDRGSFDGLSDVGDRRLAFHGTREEIGELIVKNGFKPSEIGDYGSGVYLATSPKTGVGYADNVTISRSLGKNKQPVVVTTEVATGKVLDFLADKDRFLEWAKARFDPTDLTDPVNAPYVKPNVPVNPLVDNSYTRYLPRYAKEMGFDSILIRDAEGLGKDFWVVHDPSRLVIRQAISLDVPTNRELFPSTIDGRIAATVEQVHTTSQSDK
ncbi:MAG TPA: hypothetical protein V6D00_05275 [Pantanalinema sp.]